MDSPRKLSVAELDKYSVRIMNDTSGMVHTFMVITGPDGSYGYGFAPREELTPFGPGRVFDDTYHEYTHEGATIPLTPTQYSLLAQFINHSIDNPPYYNFLGQQCTVWVIQGLNQAGIVNSLYVPDISNKFGVSIVATAVYNPLWGALHQKYPVLSTMLRESLWALGEFGADVIVQSMPRGGAAQIVNNSDGSTVIMKPNSDGGSIEFVNYEKSNEAVLQYFLSPDRTDFASVLHGNNGTSSLFSNGQILNLPYTGMYGLPDMYHLNFVSPDTLRVTIDVSGLNGGARSIDLMDGGFRVNIGAGSTGVSLLNGSASVGNDGSISFHDALGISNDVMRFLGGAGNPAELSSNGLLFRFNADDVTAVRAVTTGGYQLDLEATGKNQTAQLLYTPGTSGTGTVALLHKTGNGSQTLTPVSVANGGRVTLSQVNGANVLVVEDARGRTDASLRLNSGGRVVSTQIFRDGGPLAKRTAVIERDGFVSSTRLDFKGGGHNDITNKRDGSYTAKAYDADNNLIVSSNFAANGSYTRSIYSPLSGIRLRTEQVDANGNIVKTYFNPTVTAIQAAALAVDFIASRQIAMWMKDHGLAATMAAQALSHTGVQTLRQALIGETVPTFSGFVSSYGHTFMVMAAGAGGNFLGSKIDELLGLKIPLSATALSVLSNATAQYVAASVALDVFDATEGWGIQFSKEAGKLVPPDFTKLLENGIAAAGGSLLAGEAAALIGISGQNAQLGGMAASAASSIGILISGAGLGPWAILGIAFGSNFLGQAIGFLFGSGYRGRPMAVAQIANPNGYLTRIGLGVDNNGNRAIAQVLSDSVTSTINTIYDIIGGKSRTSLVWEVGHLKGQYFSKPVDGQPIYVQHQHSLPEVAIAVAEIAFLQNTQFDANANPYVLMALRHGLDESVDPVAKMNKIAENIAAAQVYSASVEDPDAFMAYLATAAATDASRFEMIMRRLARAQEMKIDLLEKNSAGNWVFTGTTEDVIHAKLWSVAASGARIALNLTNPDGTQAGTIHISNATITPTGVISLEVVGTGSTLNMKDGSNVTVAGGTRESQLNLVSLSHGNLSIRAHANLYGSGNRVEVYPDMDAGMLDGRNNEVLLGRGANFWSINSSGMITGAGNNTLYIHGNGLPVTPITISDSTINYYDSIAGKLTGTNNTVHLVTAANSVNLSGHGNSVFAASGSTVVVGSDDGRLGSINKVSGSGITGIVLANSHADFYSSNSTFNVGAGSDVGIYGSYNLTTVGSTSRVWYVNGVHNTTNVTRENASSMTIYGFDGPTDVINITDAYFVSGQTSVSWIQTGGTIGSLSGLLTVANGSTTVATLTVNELRNFDHWTVSANADGSIRITDPDMVLLSASTPQGFGDQGTTQSNDLGTLLHEVLEASPLSLNDMLADMTLTGALTELGANATQGIYHMPEPNPPSLAFGDLPQEQYAPHPEATLRF